MISSVSIDGAIGNDNQLLWHLPEDLKQYQVKTHRNICIVGKNTYDTLSFDALKNRTYIIISNKRINAPTFASIYLVKNIDDAIKKAEIIKTDNQDVYVIGGEQIYNSMIDLVDYVEITWINKLYPNANKSFPIDKLFNNFEIIDDSDWIITKPFSYKFTEYKKIKK